MRTRVPVVRANRITNGRLLAAIKDPRITAIEDAVRACSASGSYRRENVMYGRTVWPKTVIATIDDLRFRGATREQMVALGAALNDAATQDLYVGTGAPVESLGEALAQDAAAESEVRQTVALLVDRPSCPTQKRTLLQRVTKEIASSEFLRRVLLRDLSGGNGAAAR